MFISPGLAVWAAKYFYTKTASNTLVRCDRKAENVKLI